MSKKSRVFAVATALAVLACQLTWASDDGWQAEVTVTAHRAELATRVSKFVNQIAAAENEEGFPRWQTPVCPLVSGLPQQEGEFILGRLSEIARAAGAPLAGEHCSPNLYILVHPQPKELLQAMEKRNLAFTFGLYPPPPNVIGSFIATPRAVRVWYTSVERTPDGLPLQACPPYPKCTPGQAEASRLSSAVVWQLAHVFVVVDQSRLQGVSRGQLADYVALGGLAQLKPGARLGDAPTILKLFDGAPQAAPAGMTDWDQAFLKSLYATDEKSKLQRSQITQQMVRDIAP